jgi:hypothetical protein
MPKNLESVEQQNPQNRNNQNMKEYPIVAAS